MPSLSGFFLNWFIPQDLAEFNHREDLVRARMVIAAMWVNILATLSCLVAAMFGVELMGRFTEVTQTAVGITLIGCTAGLFIFRATASFFWVGNFYGLMAFVAMLVGLLAVPREEVSALIVLLLVVPLFVNLSAGLVSGLAWTVLIALTPFALSHYWRMTSQQTAFLPMFMGIWITVTSLLAFILYGYDRISRQMSQRLNAASAKFEFNAAHDSLTGLVNRATFDRRITEAIEKCRLHGQIASLFYIDLNDFKPINDQYGHQAGDAVLVAVAERLQRMVRASDTVARLGGDEFVVLLIHSELNANLELLTERMKSEIAAPVTTGNLCLSVSASIGVVRYPCDGDSVEVLIQRADALMYEQKKGIKDKGICRPDCSRFSPF